LGTLDLKIKQGKLEIGHWRHHALKLDMEDLKPSNYTPNDEVEHDKFENT
jgi:hypothetical protein